MDTYIHLDHRSPKGWCVAGGFSLVETTIAVGIVGFAFTAAVGLLPLGFVTFRKAMDVSVSSQISQRVLNDAQQTDFDILTSGGADSPQIKPIRYFDVEGNELKSPTNSVYQVNTVVKSTTKMPNEAKFADLATVVVQVANNPANKTIKSNAGETVWNDPRLPMVSYSGLVSRKQ